MFFFTAGKQSWKSTRTSETNIDALEALPNPWAPKGSSNSKAELTRAGFPWGNTCRRYRVHCLPASPQGLRGSKGPGSKLPWTAQEQTRWPFIGGRGRYQGPSLPQSLTHTIAETHKGHLVFLVSDSSTQNRRDLIQVLGKLRIKKTEVLTG